MEIDYSKTFPEDTGGCQHKKPKRLTKPSTEFTVYLNQVKGRKDPRDIAYWHYVCAMCYLPSKWYIQYCWYCMNDFYGTPGLEKCLPCQNKPQHPEG